MFLTRPKSPAFWLAGLAATLMTISAPSVAAVLFSFAPMTQSFAPSGRGASQAYTLTNTSANEDLTVEVFVTSRDMDLDGKETNDPKKAENDFLIYPPQVILKPGETQIVRVNWVGDPNPSRELAYRLIAEQLPVPTDTQTTTAQGRTIGITTLIRYSATVYITPPGAQPKLALVRAEPQKSKTGADQLALLLENQGTAHFILSDLLFTLTPKSQPDKAVTLEELPGITGENILAGQKRRFVVPWPKGLPVGEVTVTFQPKR